MTESNCYNVTIAALSLRVRVRVRVIDKYQTGVLSTTCDSPTNAISDCLNVDRVRKRFVVPSFFLVAADA